MPGIGHHLSIHRPGYCLTSDGRVSTINLHWGSNVFHAEADTTTREPSPRHAGYARSSDTPIRSCARPPNRQAHSANHKRLSSDAAWVTLSGTASAGRKRWVTSKWEMAPDRNREFKYYRLTEKGRKQLVVEESQWKQMAEAVARVMWPVIEEI